MVLHGINTLPNQGNPQQYTFKAKGTHSRVPTGVENQFKNCFDHNRGGCSCPSCSFPHVCRRCGLPSHTTPNCPQGPRHPRKCLFSKITTPLQEQHYVPPMPIKISRLNEQLQHHPNSKKKPYKGLRWFK